VVVVVVVVVEEVKEEMKAAAEEMTEEAVEEEETVVAAMVAVVTQALEVLEALVDRVVVLEAPEAESLPLGRVTCWPCCVPRRWSFGISTAQSPCTGFASS
jgi:hypothetical protein